MLSILEHVGPASAITDFLDIDSKIKLQAVNKRMYYKVMP
jgi:hypothetical protein